VIAAAADCLVISQGNEVFRVDVLLADGEDSALHRSLVDDFRDLAEGVHEDVADRVAWFFLDLNQFRFQDKGILMKPCKTFPERRFSAEKQRLADSQIIDSFGDLALFKQIERRGVPAGDDSKFKPELGFDFVFNSDQLIKIILIGYYAAVAGEVRADAGQFDVFKS